MCMTFGESGPLSAADQRATGGSTIVTSVETLMALANIQARLAEMEAAHRAEQEATRQEQARILARKGEVEKALRTLREQSERAAKEAAVVTTTALGGGSGAAPRSWPSAVWLTREWPKEPERGEAVPCPNCGAALVLIPGRHACWRCFQCGNAEAVGIAPAASRPMTAAIVTYRRDGDDHAELFDAEGDGINRYEQVGADNVRIFLASKGEIVRRPASEPYPD